MILIQTDDVNTNANNCESSKNCHILAMLKIQMYNNGKKKLPQPNITVTCAQACTVKERTVHGWQVKEKDVRMLQAGGGCQTQSAHTVYFNLASG